MFKTASKMATAKTAGSVDSVDSSVDGIGSSSDGGDRNSDEGKGRKASSNDHSSLWTSQNKRGFGHSFNMCNSHLRIYVHAKAK